MYIVNNHTPEQGVPAAAWEGVEKIASVCDGSTTMATIYEMAEELASTVSPEGFLNLKPGRSRQELQETVELVRTNERGDAVLLAARRQHAETAQLISLVETHESQCDEAIVSCPYGCGQCMPRRATR